MKEIKSHKKLKSEKQRNFIKNKVEKNP